MGKLMKRAITTFTAVLLTTLTIIRLLPILISPDTLVTTYGLRHLNFLPPTAESINSCANIDSTAPCTMYLSFDTFANYWYPGLMALGIYCLIDGCLRPTVSQRILSRTRTVRARKKT